MMRPMSPANFMKIKEGLRSHDPALGDAMESPAHTHNQSCWSINIFTRCNMCASPNMRFFPNTNILNLQKQ